jgi:hypothetical protein
MKKVSTTITEANGGVHSTRQYKKMVAMLTDCQYTAPRLYHLVLFGCSDAAGYQSALKAICFELRRRKIPLQYHAALEEEKDKEKNLHLHVFLLTEAKYRDPGDFINGKTHSWLITMLAARGMNYYLCDPQDPMHRAKNGWQLRYMTLAGKDKLEDAILRISYLVKNRSKEGLQRIYYSSRPSRAKAIQ